MSRFRSLLLAVAVCILVLTAVPLKAQESKTNKYSPSVVAKAEKILADLGLRRSGKSIQSTATVEISRTITAQTRKKRELRIVHNAWKGVADQITALRQEQNRLNAQYGELNLQLAKVAGVDAAANNRIVGLINATVARKNALTTERDRLKAELNTKRATLNQAEADYAETILSIRSDFDTVRQRIEESLKDDKAQIAFRVLQANYGTPEKPTPGMILRALEKRIEKLEQEVFSESIKLNVDRGSLYVNVVIGRKTTPMVVDSGATLISLPNSIATDLGITVPEDARRLRLVLADGRSIPARAVTIAKVRVGEFEAENVQAAVLDGSAVEAEPLLGMSFLGNFKFEINSADKTLKLLRVDSE
jgi:aspartyl protease family protein